MLEAAGVHCWTVGEIFGGSSRSRGRGDGVAASSTYKPVRCIAHSCSGWRVSLYSKGFFASQAYSGAPRQLEGSCRGVLDKMLPRSKDISNEMAVGHKLMYSPSPSSPRHVRGFRGARHDFPLGWTLSIRIHARPGRMAFGRIVSTG